MDRRRIRRSKKRTKRNRVVAFVLLFFLVLAIIFSSKYIKKEEKEKTAIKPIEKIEKVKLVETNQKEKILSRITDVLGSYETYYLDGTPQAANIENSASKINEKLIAPNEEFSVNEAFEPYTSENGYQTGGSYSNGEIIQTIGGGICQTSSTLYNALLMAEIKVTERYNHQMLVGYVDPARDATISDTTQDLKFINNTKDYIRIVAYAESGVCNMTIYGREYRDPRREIVYQSVELSSEEPKVKFIADEALPFSEQQVKKESKRGVVAELWKIELYDGVEVKREKWHTNRYKRLDKEVRVGIRRIDGTSSEKLRQIIDSQDETLIDETLRQIYEGQNEGY